MTPTDIIDFKAGKSRCKDCHAAPYCLSGHLNDKDLTVFNAISKHRKPLKRGERLIHNGQNFHSLYIVRSGSVKTYIESSDGEQQITGFYFPGDLLGIDGINSGYHIYNVEALESSSFCEIKFPNFEKLMQDIPSLQQQLFLRVSKEIGREQKLMLLLGRMDSKRKLACFIINMSSIMQLKGYSATHINLSMTRYDIANYLSLAIETVSRLFSGFQKEGILTVDRRDIVIQNMDKLKSIAQNNFDDLYGDSHQKLVNRG